MNLSEENRLILSMAREFAEKYVEPAAVEIEKSGIPGELLDRMSEMGYLSAALPEELGGAGVEKSSYLLILETIAKHSPSLSFYTYLQNSLVLGALSLHHVTDAAGAAIKSIASGRKSGTVILDSVLSARGASSLELLEEGSVAGSAEYVLNPGADYVVAAADTKDGSALCLLDGGAWPSVHGHSLGFRGIGFGSLVIGSARANTHVIASTGGRQSVESALSRGNCAAAAIALGMAESTIERAVDYAKGRKTFGSRLVEYTPLAHSLSSVMAEIEICREYVYGKAAEGEKEGLVAKLHATQLAVSASKLSMQVHGGNGYFEEYRIEKFYRDAMALNAFSGNRNADRERLARMLLGDGSASI